MQIAVYPGSFDPPTYGHLDIIRRADNLFDRLIIAVAVNESKRYIFSAEERRDMLAECTKDLQHVEVEIFTGMTVDFVRSKGSQIILRGIRSVKDFEYEFHMALTNRRMAKDVETVFIMPDQNFTYLSSKLTREVVALGGPVEEFVPPSIADILRRKIVDNRKSD
jgi:pantetheine-phosphate adenylyltransferase